MEFCWWFTYGGMCICISISFYEKEKSLVSSVEIRSITVGRHCNSLNGGSQWRDIKFNSYEGDPFAKRENRIFLRSRTCWFLTETLDNVIIFIYRQWNIFHHSQQKCYPESKPIPRFTRYFVHAISLSKSPKF